MKKWKMIRNITLSIFMISLIPIIWWLYEAIWVDINGYRYIIPGPTLTKWYDIFKFNSHMYLMIWIIPAIIDIIIFIDSLIKIKNNDLSQKDR